MTDSDLIQKTGCIFCGNDVEGELALKQRLVHADFIKARYGDVAEWAYPMHTDGLAVTAMKKAARTITHIDKEKCWCSSDINEALVMLRNAIDGAPTMRPSWVRRKLAALSRARVTS